jgi:hypothetical protein
MFDQRAPSSWPIHSSPLVVPRYSAGARLGVGRHRLALDGPPGLALGQALVQPLPGRAGVARDVGAGRPWGLVRGQTVVPSIGNTQAVSASRGCTTIGKPMSPTRLGILRPMRCQVSAWPVEPVDAAVVLLVQPVGVAGAQAHAMRVVEGDVAASNLPPPPCPRISVDQLRPASCDSCTPPPDIAKYRCAGSRGSTMTECSFGPSGVPSCTVPIHSRNCASSLTAGSGCQVPPPSSRAEQALRRGAGVPAAAFAGMARRQPEGVVDRAAGQGVGGIGKGRRLLRLLPAAAQVGGAEDRSAPGDRSWPRPAACGRRAGPAAHG